VAAVVAVAGVALAKVLTTGGSSKKTASPATTSTAAAPTATTSATTATTAAPSAQPAPKLSPVNAVFDPTQRATFYTVSVTVSGQGTPAYTWRLSPPKDNPGCNKFAQVPGMPNEAVWHHADTDGCTHLGIQHDGTVYVTVTTTDWQCTQSFFGTLTKTGTSAQRCTRRA